MAKKTKTSIPIIEPNLEGFSKKPIEPGINYFFDGTNWTCVAGHHLPCFQRQTKDGEMKETEIENLCFITSDGELFSATPQQLAAKDVFLNKESFHFPSRWSLENIKRFLSAKKEGVKTGVSFLKTFTEIKTKLKTLVDLPEEKWYDIVACYIIATYFFRLFSAFPILFIHGVQDAGKSKLGECIELTAYHGVNSSLISPSALFRCRDAQSSTIILDEAEYFSKDKDRQGDTIPILLGSYKYGTTVMKSTETKTGFRVQNFSIYGPTVICNVYGISLSTLLSRCIVLVILRSNNKKILNAEINRNDEEWSWIRDFLHTLQLEEFNRVRTTKESLIFDESLIGERQGKKSLIVGREREIWLPLLTIAKIISEEDSSYSFMEFQRFVEERIQEKKGFENERPEVVLLKALEPQILMKYEAQKTLVQEANYWFSVQEITDLLRRGEDDGEQSKFINNKSTSAKLKRLGFGKRRTGSASTQYEITPVNYVDCCRRLNVEIDYPSFPKKDDNSEVDVLPTPSTLNRATTPENTTLNQQNTTLTSTPNSSDSTPIQCRSVASVANPQGSEK